MWCLSQTRLPPAHFWAQFSRRNLEFSEWFPQIRAPPKWGGNVASSPADTLLNALWRQFLASFFPRRLVWAQAVPVNCFHTVSVVRAQKMLFFVFVQDIARREFQADFSCLCFVGGSWTTRPARSKGIQRWCGRFQQGGFIVSQIWRKCLIKRTVTCFPICLICLWSAPWKTVENLVGGL